MTRILLSHPPHKTMYEYIGNFHFKFLTRKYSQSKNINSVKVKFEFVTRKYSKSKNISLLCSAQIDTLKFTNKKEQNLTLNIHIEKDFINILVFHPAIIRLHKIQKS